MNLSLCIGILVFFFACLPDSSSAIKCFKCKSDTCDSSFNFRSDFQDKDSRYTDEGCTFNSTYIPACKFIINEELLVRERGCGNVGVRIGDPVCTNMFKDVLICYCISDWCNGIDVAHSAAKVAQEHFRRQEEHKNAAVKISMSSYWLALILVWSFRG